MIMKSAYEINWTIWDQMKISSMFIIMVNLDRRYPGVYRKLCASHLSVFEQPMGNAFMRRELNEKS